MAKARSPRYPVIGLKEAIEKIRMVYNEDYQNKIQKRVVGEHMGYGSLNGKSLGVISAVIKYGLLEGRANDMRVSDKGLAIVAHESGSPERMEAVKAAARQPDLFAELDARFPNGKASDSAIRSYLLTQRKFLPNAADVAIRAYRETKEFVEEETLGYDSSTEDDTASLSSLDYMNPGVPEQLIRPQPGASERPKAHMRQDIFTLEEGQAVLQWPEGMSFESYEDFKAWMNLMLRKAARSVPIRPLREEERVILSALGYSDDNITELSQWQVRDILNRNMKKRDILGDPDDEPVDEGDSAVAG